MAGEADLDGLLRQLQDEGVAKGRAEAERLVAAARAEGEEILRQARAQAEAEIRRAEARIQVARQAGLEALGQARRDTVLAVRNQLRELFQRILERESDPLLQGEQLQRLLAAVAEGWARAVGARVQTHEVLKFELSEEARAALGKAFQHQLQADLGAGVEFVAHPRVRSGFRVGHKGGALQFEFTDEALAEVLDAFLGPEFMKLMD